MLWYHWTEHENFLQQFKRVWCYSIQDRQLQLGNDKDTLSKISIALGGTQLCGKVCLSSLSNSLVLIGFVSPPQNIKSKVVHLREYLICFPALEACKLCRSFAVWNFSTLFVCGKRRSFAPQLLPGEEERKNVWFLKLLFSFCIL